MCSHHFNETKVDEHGNEDAQVEEGFIAWDIANTLPAVLFI